MLESFDSILSDEKILCILDSHVIWYGIESDKKSFGPICEKDIPNLEGVYFEGHIDPRTFNVAIQYAENKIKKIHLPSCIYNHIKGFFHEHKWHDSSEDSVLPSFIYDELVDFASVRADVVNQLLDAYHDKFEGHLESWIIVNIY